MQDEAAVHLQVLTGHETLVAGQTDGGGDVVCRAPMDSRFQRLRRPSGERLVKDIRRATHRHFSAEDKLRILVDGLRGEDSIAELCRKEGIAQGL